MAHRVLESFRIFFQKFPTNLRQQLFSSHRNSANYWSERFVCACRSLKVNRVSCGRCIRYSIQRVA